MSDTNVNNQSAPPAADTKMDPPTNSGESLPPTAEASSSPKPMWKMFLVMVKTIEVPLSFVLILIAGVIFIGALIYLQESPRAPGKYYIKTLGGYSFSNTPGYDVILGASYKTVTEEVIADYEASRNKPAEKVKNIPPAPPFFNPGTGEPLTWYNASGDGVKLFSLPGYDPCTGEPLRPINREIAQAFCKEATAVISAATFECNGITGLKISWPFGMMGGIVINNVSGTVIINN